MAAKDLPPFDLSALVESAWSAAGGEVTVLRLTAVTHVLPAPFLNQPIDVGELRASRPASLLDRSRTSHVGVTVPLP